MDGRFKSFIKSQSKKLKNEDKQLKFQVNFSKCDVFSLGMAILRMIGDNRFEKEKGMLNEDETALKHFIDSLREEIPLEIYDTLLLMLEYNANRRPDLKMLYLMMEKKKVFLKF